MVMWLSVRRMATFVRFGKNLKELRLHVCQQSPASQGTRDFIDKHYVALKQANPDFPFLIREATGVQPKCFARYEFGREEVVPLDNMTSSQVQKTIEGLAKS